MNYKMEYQAKLVTPAEAVKCIPKRGNLSYRNGGE